MSPVVAARGRCHTVAVDDRARALDAAHRSATAFLGTLDERPVWPRASLDEMLDVFGGALPEEGADPAAVVEELGAVLSRPQCSSVPVLMMVAPV